jgi:hypothetical protein
MSQYKVTPLRINLRTQTVQKTINIDQSPISSSITSVINAHNGEAVVFSEEFEIVARKPFTPTVRKTKSILRIKKTKFNKNKENISDTSYSSSDSQSPVVPVKKIVNKFVRPISSKKGKALTTTFINSVYDGNLSNLSSDSSSDSSTDSSREDENVEDLNEMLANLDVDDNQVLIQKLIILRLYFKLLLLLLCFELFTIKVGRELKVSVPIPLGRTDVNRLKRLWWLKIAYPMEESAVEILNDDNLLYRDCFFYSVCNMV